MSCCSNEPHTTKKTILLEFLFLDKETCEPCGNTAQALEVAVGLTAAPLAAMAAELLVEKVHVADAGVAEAHGFLSSPTIRIDGTDIDPARTEESCPSCGELAGGETAVACRNWHWRGEVFQSAPVGRIVEAVMAAATGNTRGVDDAGAGPYRLPDNLASFFAGRERGDALCG